MKMIMGFTEAFVLATMVVIIIMYVRQHYGEVDIVAGNDGRRYIVRKLPDRGKAADLLAAINVKLTKLVQHMVARYPDDPDVRRLHENYNPDALSEGGTEVGYTSYSVNKGEKIVMCLRQPRTDAFVDLNVLVYVAIHELGHLMTDEIGHTPVFWGNFKRLAAEAVEIGVYTRVDYETSPEAYCGISISSSVV
jgi:hypothetical protein